MKALYAFLAFSVVVGLALLTTPFIAPEYLAVTRTATVSVTYTTRATETYLTTATSLQFHFPCKGRALCWQGTVTRIIDGDTLEVDGVQIRLALVDAPEPNQPNGIAAKSLVEKLCPVGSRAVVDQDDTQRRDSFGRTLAVVWCGGKNTNAELLYAGLARIDTRFCARSEFQDEDWAKKYGCA